MTFHDFAVGFKWNCQSDLLNCEHWLACLFAFGSLRVRVCVFWFWPPSHTWKTRSLPLNFVGIEVLRNSVVAQRRHQLPRKCRWREKLFGVRGSCKQILPTTCSSSSLTRRACLFGGHSLCELSWNVPRCRGHPRTVQTAAHLPTGRYEWGEGGSLPINCT